MFPETNISNTNDWEQAIKNMGIIVYNEPYASDQSIDQPFTRDNVLELKKEEIQSDYMPILELTLNY